MAEPRVFPDSMEHWTAIGWYDEEPPTALQQLQLAIGWCANCMIDEDDGKAHTSCAGREGFVCGCHECEDETLAGTQPDGDGGNDGGCRSG